MNEGRHSRMSVHQKRRYQRRRKQQKRLALLVVAVSLACCAAFIIRGTGASMKSDSSSHESNVSAPSTPETSAPKISSRPTQIESQSGQPTVHDNFSSLVPKKAAVLDGYFDDAIFMGDSRTEGLILNTGLSNAKSYTHKGLMVDTVFTAPVILRDGEKVSVMEALKKTSFSKVYIMFGVNETGWAYSSLFIKKYAEIIDAIRAINPKATIYVQSILPVSQKVSSTHAYVKMSKINEYNQLIRKMAQEKKVYYLQVGQVMAGANGYLPENAATDGIHLKKEYCQTWLDYLKTHTVSREG